VAEGFPTSVFVVDEDLTRHDGVIRCTHKSAEELVQLGWRIARAVRIVLEFGPFA
jgi:hypothetical protein